MRINRQLQAKIWNITDNTTFQLIATSLTMAILIGGPFVAYFYL